MNQELEKVIEIIKREEVVRKLAKEKEPENKDFSYVNFFAGDEFNQELNRIKTEEAMRFRINQIDFDRVGKENSEWMENKIKEICAENISLVEAEELPIIWFKNIDRAGTAIQKTLLSIFDPSQNSSEESKLDNYHLIATSSTHDMSKLPKALVSRLNCINVRTAQPFELFLNKYFNLVLGGTIFFIVLLLTYLFWPNRSKEIEE